MRQVLTMQDFLARYSTNVCFLLLALALAPVVSGCAGGPGIFGNPQDLSKVRQTKLDGPGSLRLVGTGTAEQPRNLPKSRIGNPPFYTVFGKQYTVMASAAGYNERGGASWYGSKFHGRHTSSGERYNMYDMTAAHKHLPLPTFVRVTNVENGRSLVVKVNDRGPFHGDRIIDLSFAAASQLGMLEKGTALVDVEAISVNTNSATPGAIMVHASDSIATPAQATNKDVSQLTHEVPASFSSMQPNQTVTIIQVGAFSSLANATILRNRVNAVIQVDAAYIEEAAHKSLYRVRFGIASDVPVDAVMAELGSAGIRKYSVISQ